MENVMPIQDRRINTEDRRSNIDRRTNVQNKEALEVVAGGAFTESAGGIAAVVLSILGLIGIAPMLLAAISAIVIGGVLLIKGAAVSAEYFKFARTATNDKIELAEFGGGLSSEIIAGIGALVLGILSLISITPAILLPIAAITLGTGVALGSDTTARLNNLRASQQNRLYQRVVREMTAASSGAQALIGLGAIVLGILALVGIAPMPLTIIAMLSLGVVILLAGTSVGGKMVSIVYGS